MDRVLRRRGGEGEREMRRVGWFGEGEEEGGKGGKGRGR